MALKKTVLNVGNKAEKIADAVVKSYAAKGYTTQMFSFCTAGNGERGYMVQVKNTGNGLGGFMKKTLLCEVFASLKLTVVDDDLIIEVGKGKWVDKSIAIATGMFVLWPLTVLGTWGCWQQRKLYKTIFHDAETLALYNDKAA